MEYLKWDYFKIECKIILTTLLTTYHDRKFLKTTKSLSRNKHDLTPHWCRLSYCDIKSVISKGCKALYYSETRKTSHFRD